MLTRNYSISNLLIALSVICTAMSYFASGLLMYGMSRYYILSHAYVGVVLQFLLYQFLHGGLLHLFSNAIFLYAFGNPLEALLGKLRYFFLFLGNVIFVGCCLLLFSSGNTIGISGFAMAVLAYTFLELRHRRDPQYMSAGLFLFINIAIGFTEHISLIGHLSGAIFGAIFFFLRRK